MKRWRPLCLAVLICIALGSAARFAAATVFDAPEISFIESGRTSFEVRVTAGPSGATDGFTIEWMPASVFDLIGYWPAPNDPRIQSANFFGTPTLNISEGTGTFRLAPSTTAGVQVGDLFDETGVALNGVIELPEGSEFVVRVRANGGVHGEASGPSQAIRLSTTSRTVQDCTYTLGYWKNHSSAWPVSTLTIGTATYAKPQLLLILSQPAQGNGLVSLFHQLVTVKLNLVQGATPTAAVASAISAADAMIGGLRPPPVGSGELMPGDTSALTQTLDDFNNGITGPGHCKSTPVKQQTWGNLKVSYR